MILASPFAAEHPAAAGAFALGSALPDLDAWSRIFGKRAFLAAHQTLTHSLSVVATAGAATWVALALARVGAPYAPLALALGMVLHRLLDVTSTHDITLFAPFTGRRFCTEWVFFIDAIVVAATAAVLGAYLSGRVALRRRARRSAPPGTIALIPSALVPWRFLGCARVGDDVETFVVGAGGQVRGRRMGGLPEEELREQPAETGARGGPAVLEAHIQDPDVAGHGELQRLRHGSDDDAGAIEVPAREGESRMMAA